jgi:MinD-like ATPase involved in chromosome partitioning or flagellar assembly
VRRIIVVGAGKGGVGTSTVAALLAATTAADGTRVLLIDAADRMGTLHHMLGVEPTHTLAELRTVSNPSNILLHVSPRLSLVSASTHASNIAAGERKALMRRLMDLYPQFGAVVIDAGSSAESLISACRIGATRLLAVTANDRISIIATYALIKLLHERLPGIQCEVVANRTDREHAESLHEYLNGAAIRFLSRTVLYGGVVPDDADFGRVLAAGLGTDEAALGSRAAHAIRTLRDATPVPAPESPGPLLSLLRKD